MTAPPPACLGELVPFDPPGRPAHQARPLSRPAPEPASVHDRGPGHPLRGRGPGDHRPAADGHLRPQRHARASGTECRSPFADLPAGAAFGTLVHGILEAVDASAPDLLAEVGTRAADALAAHPMREVQGAALAAAIEPTLRTPLGPLARGLALTGIPPIDRLAELGFELPLGGSAAASLADLAALMRQHLTAGDPLVGYADLLAEPALGTSMLRGFLTGSIDAVLRVRGSARPRVSSSTTRPTCCATPPSPRWSGSPAATDRRCCRRR